MFLRQVSQITNNTIKFNTPLKVVNSFIKHITHDLGNSAQRINSNAQCFKNNFTAPKLNDTLSFKELLKKFQAMSASATGTNRVKNASEIILAKTIEPLKSTGLILAYYKRSLSDNNKVTSDTTAMTLPGAAADCPKSEKMAYIRRGKFTRSISEDGKVSWVKDIMTPVQIRGSIVHHLHVPKYKIYEGKGAYRAEFTAYKNDFPAVSQPERSQQDFHSMSSAKYLFNEKVSQLSKYTPSLTGTIKRESIKPTRE